ncbi:hypothetical protein N7492_001818 [Penicillium capsulatum]|uniref:Uncharacterized protein n=1 Tax=Penicillium capsulatum TaxID=69766 RepID=A0A9W9IUB9_9EURO|nr:hypothetical protein N7492_001818 [Penicillium capsulatum]KAJ6129133.1 hypothetical protein N7512_001913 [Penicillium capsulatum]
MTRGWDESKNAHQQMYGEKKHDGKLSQEIIASGGSIEAMKAWEDQQRTEGKRKPVSHSFAEEEAITEDHAKAYAENNPRVNRDERHVQGHGADR